MPISKPKKIRDLLSDLREERDKGASTTQIAERAFGIRQLVAARAHEFNVELKTMSQKELKARGSLRKIMQERYEGNSLNNLSKILEDSPELGTEMLQKHQKNAQPTTADHTSFNTDDIGMESVDELSLQMELKPGDLVEYWPTKGRRLTAIILRRPDENKRYMIISDRGHVDYANPNRFRFIIPEFIEGYLVPAGQILQADSSLEPFHKALKAFKAEASRVSESHKERLADIHSLLVTATKGTDQITSHSVYDVCKAIFSSEIPSSAELYSVFTAMTLDRKHFLPDSTLHMTVPTFEARPKEEVKLIASISEWSRSKSPQFNAFIQVAQKLYQFGKSFDRNENNYAIRKVQPQITLTKTDGMFVQFMMNACLERKEGVELEIYDIPISQIVKELKFYPGQKIDRALIHLCLQDIGIITPWDANLRRTRTAALTGHNTSAVAEDHQGYIDAHFAQNQVEDLGRLGMKDASDSIRHDFGNMPVYTIDSETAAELDDGISIDGDWIHIHIADPSSYITPTSRLGAIAKFRTETCYLYDRIYPMLPPSIAMTHFSLGAREGGMPTMSTSVRLDQTGSIIDLKIRAGVVRNIRKTTYSRVDEQVFGISRERRLVSTLNVNWMPELEKNTKSRTDIIQLNEEDDKNIKDLQKMLHRAFQYRLANGFINQFGTDKDLTLQPSDIPLSLTDFTQPVFYTGRPAIKLDVSNTMQSPAINLVTEAALLANRATTLFCSDRGIPIIYRSQRIDLSQQESTELMSQRDERGALPALAILPFQNRFGAARFTLQPEPFDIIGLPNGYTNATSPLRRYIDMAIQWQIQSYLRKEPYQVQVAQILPHIVRRSKALKLVQNAGEKHWVIQLLRQIGFQQLPDFEAVITVNDYQKNFPSKATIEALGMNCLVERNAKDPVMDVGGAVRVRISKLDLLDNVIYCKRVG